MTTETKYVRITRQGKDYNKIIPVADMGLNYRFYLSDYYQDIFYSECELVDLTTLLPKEQQLLNKDQERLIIASSHFLRNQSRRLYKELLEAFPSVFNKSLDQEIADFKAEVRKNPNWQGDKQLENGFTITADQIKELVRLIEESPTPGSAIKIYLKEWFPEVFKPVKTYTLLDRFKAGNNTYRLAGSGSKLMAIDEENGFIESECFVQDLLHITADELKVLFNPDLPYVLED